MPLKVSDGIGAWIKDFKKSDAPQFKGKSEKERRDQAIAAYLSAKRGDQKEGVDEKIVGYKSDSKLSNLKVPIKRKQGKILNRKTGKFEDVKEAAPKPLNRSDHTHTVDIAGEGRFRVKAKSMDHAKKLAFKKAGISKLHGHPTMEPKTRIMGEAKRVVHSDRPDSLKSLRVMHPKSSGSKPPFEGPYRKAGEVKKDKFGNVIKNRAKHLARAAAKSTTGIKEETNFQVNIEGLPMMFMSAMGPGELKQKLRKIVKQPSMIQSVKRVTDADVKKTFRLKAQGRDEEENEE